jgi:excisionase family DNA binding protein
VTSEKLTIKEAAKALGVHPATIRRKIKDNKIKWEKDEGTRGQYYIPASEIDTYRTSQAIVAQTREIDVTGITNEIYEHRIAVINLYDRISEMHTSEIATADYVYDISAKLDTLTAKIDELTLKLEPLDEGASRVDEVTLNLEPHDEGASSVVKPFSEPEIRGNLKEFFEPVKVKAPAAARYRQYWWQFWRPEKL